MRRLSAMVLGVLGLLASAPAFANDTVYYYYNDAQGSPVAVTDASGNVVERTQYAPYGQVLNRPEHDGPGYTKHEEDAATGLTNMQQRYDDKAIGRMLSLDPVDVDPGTGANFNRYAYANDNPYRYTDPDGRIPFGDPNTSSYVSVDVAGSAAGTLANALNWVDTNIAMPLGPDGGAELHIAIAPMVGALREAAAVTKTAEAAKTIEGGTKEAVSMSKAVDKAIAHTGSDAEVGMTKGGNVQFSKSVTDQSGNTVTKNARFDVNPSNAHVQKQGPHLNIETQQNGKIIQNDHIPIDPKTIRPGDHG